MKRTVLFLLLGLGVIGVLVGFALSAIVGGVFASIAVVGAIWLGVPGDENPPGTYGP